MKDILQNRREALSHLISARGLSAAAITSSAALRYFTGFPLSEHTGLTVLILSPAESLILIPPQAAEQIPQDSGLSILPYGSEAEAACRLAAAISGPIGVEKDALSPEGMAQLCRWAHCSQADIQDITPVLDSMRCRKDPAELAALGEACRRTDVILHRWSAHVRSGTNQSLLRRTLDEISLEEGVTSSCPGILIAIGPNSAFPHGADTPAVLQPGDPLFIDCGARWDGYYCDITRTFFLGEPEAEAEKVYRIVLAAQEAAIAAVKPGVPLRAVDRAARQVIEQAGYGEYFTHRTGHGLGLAVHEFPSVGPDSQQVAEPGMVITIEPGIYLPGRWGVRIEDDVVVEADGCRVLNAFPKAFEEMILPR